MYYDWNENNLKSKILGTILVICCLILLAIAVLAEVPCANINSNYRYTITLYTMSGQKVREDVMVPDEYSNTEDGYEDVCGTYCVIYHSPNGVENKWYGPYSVAHTLIK